MRILSRSICNMIRFEERQKFNQWWLWLILLGSLAITVVSVHSLLATNQAWVAWVAIGGMLVLTALAAGITVRTEITDAFIRMSCTSYFSRTIDWDDVAQAYVRKYSPLGEYGGWGYRLSPKHGTAYNVMGDWGIQLVLKDGQQILIGTQHPEHLTEILDRRPGGAAGASSIAEVPIRLRERLKG